MTTVSEIDIADMTEGQIKAAFKSVYDSFPSPRQVLPRTPAVARVLNCDTQDKKWRVYAKSAGFVYAVYQGDTAYVYSLAPLGATYYYL